MRKSDVKIGMYVTMLDDYAKEIKKGTIWTVLKIQFVGSNYFILDHKGNKSYLAPSCKMFRKAEPSELPNTIVTSKPEH